MIYTLSDVSRAHLKQFYHSIQIQDEVFFYDEILRWGLPSWDASNSKKKIDLQIIMKTITFGAW